LPPLHDLWIYEGPVKLASSEPSWYCKETPLGLPRDALTRILVIGSCSNVSLDVCVFDFSSSRMLRLTQAGLYSGGEECHCVIMVSINDGSMSIREDLSCGEEI
jgi:hypothetical protein